jgi:hypothetical protein
VFGTKAYQTLSPAKQSVTIAVFNLCSFLLPSFLWAYHAGVQITIPALWRSAANGASSNTVISAADLLQGPLPLKWNLSILLAVWGAVWALAFYIPAGVMALKLGGLQHAALLTNLFDAVGFFAAALLSYYAMELGRVGNWKPLLAWLASAGLLALGGMWGAMRLDLKTSTSVSVSGEKKKK